MGYNEFFGQKTMNSYSQDIRDKAIELYKEYGTSLSVSKLLKIRYNTICDWVKQYKKTGKCVVIKPEKEGRNRLFDDKERLLTYLAEHPDALIKDMREALAPHTSYACFYKTVLRMGLTYKKKNVGTSKDVKRRELNIKIWSLK
jgi:transposase